MIDPKFLKPHYLYNGDRILSSFDGKTVIYEDIRDRSHYILEVSAGKTSLRKVGTHKLKTVVDVELTFDPNLPMEVIDRLFKLAVLK